MCFDDIELFELNICLWTLIALIRLSKRSESEMIISSTIGDIKSKTSVDLS